MSLTTQPVHTLFKEIYQSYEDPIKSRLYTALRDIIHKKVLGPKATIQTMFAKYDIWSEHIRLHHDAALITAFNAVLHKHTQPYANDIIKYICKEYQTTNVVRTTSSHTRDIMYAIGAYLFIAMYVTFAIAIASRL